MRVWELTMTTSTSWTFSRSNIRVRTSRLVALSSATNTLSPVFPFVIPEAFGIGPAFPCCAEGFNGLPGLGRSSERACLASSAAKANSPSSGLSCWSESKLALREASLEGGTSDTLVHVSFLKEEGIFFGQGMKSAATEPTLGGRAW